MTYSPQYRPTAYSGKHS